MYRRGVKKKPVTKARAKARRPAKNTASKKLPKRRFKVGQWVRDKDGSYEGEVTHYIPKYDEYLGSYRVQVREADRTKLYRNEYDLVRVAKPRTVREAHARFAKFKAIRVSRLRF